MNTPARVASLVLGIEALGVVVLVAWQIVALAAGDTDSAVSAIALIMLTAIGAAALTAFAVGVARRISWGRSGGIVAQLLILAVALGAVTGQYAHPLIGLVLAIVGVLGLVPLVLDVRRANRERRQAEKDDAAR